MAALSLLERTRLRKEREATATAASTRSSSPVIPPSSPPSRSSSPAPTLDFVASTTTTLSSGSLSNLNPGRNNTIAQRRSMGDRILKKVKLDNDSGSRAEFQQFIETASHEERDALQVAYTLRLSDMFSKSVQEAAATWSPTKTLEKALWPIIYSLMLMPTIKFYSGNLTSILTTVARDAGIKQLPKDDDDGDALASWLNKETNNAKYLIKKIISDSTESGSDIANIADLTDKLLSTHAKHFNATLSLYFRVAFIRSHIGQHAPKAFWSKIDDELETDIYKNGPEGVVDNFKTLYEEDISQYGNPSASKHSVSAELVDEKRPKWFTSLQQNAPRVQRVKVRVNKRKRGDGDGELEEDGVRPPDGEEDASGNRAGTEDEEDEGTRV